MTSYRPRWRSLLYVPVVSERFVAKAHERGADAIILELEDAVAPSEKERARSLVPEAAATVSQGGADVLVRVNRPWRLAVRDLEASIGPDVRGLVLPKVDSAEHVLALAEIAASVEAERGLEAGHTVFFPRIEGPVLEVEQLADLFRRRPQPLCQSGVRARSIVAGVRERGLKREELLQFQRNGARAHHRREMRVHGGKDPRPVGEHAVLVRDVPALRDLAFERVARRARYRRASDPADPRHGRTLSGTGAGSRATNGSETAAVLRGQGNGKRETRSRTSNKVKSG